MQELYDNAPEGSYHSSFKRRLETIKEGVPLERYAGTLTNLKAFGQGWWVGQCPKQDHEDRDPSFYVYPARGFGSTAHAHCYGCGFHGDIFDLFQACEGGELWEAMEELSRRFGVDLPERPPSWFAKQKRQKPVRDAIDRMRFDHLRRRLFRWWCAPYLRRIEDPEERRAEAETLWEATGYLARLMVERLRGGQG